MLKFIDLFAGMGGTRIGLEQACIEAGIETQCVFTSEIKDHAVDIYKHNFEGEDVFGDITKVEAQRIPDFDVLLAGFPCQAFSTAGKQHGFQDTRGTLFFDIARILKEKRPSGFILENVAGLITHDKQNRSDKIGKTLSVILNTLESLGYKVSWKVLDAQNFSVPQKRERIYIVGHRNNKPDLNSFITKRSKLRNILETGLHTTNTPFTQRLLSLYKPEDLHGKAIKDKRGGSSNIHSWDMELKGPVSQDQKELMSLLLKQRRQKKWAEKKGITWMDGMPLTTEEIYTFFNKVSIKKLEKMLNDLARKKYVVFEHPKEQYTDANNIKHRQYDETKEKGYNIVAGKLSFEITKILNPEDISNTLVATEVSKIAVIDGEGLRKLSNRECLRLSGFPDNYSSNVKQNQLYDLIGNTVVVPVIKSVSERLLKCMEVNNTTRVA